jgi:pyruvate oxidase
MLRCPWHGWDFDPITGKPPGGYDDGIETYPVEQRDDGVYVGLEAPPPHERTVTDVMAETMVNWGSRTSSGWSATRTSGSPTRSGALRGGEMEYIGIRHEGAAAFAASAFGKLTGRPRGVPDDRRPRRDQPAHRVLGREGRSRAAARAHGAGEPAGLRARRVPGAAAQGRVQRGRVEFSHLCLPGSDHAELMSLAIKNAMVQPRAGRVAHHLPRRCADRSAAEDAQPVARGALARPRSRRRRDARRSVELLRKEREAAVIIVGHGARFEMDAVIELAENSTRPVLTTFKAKGLIGDFGARSHPLGCGVLGRSGTPIASWFMNECDLLLVFGALQQPHRHHAEEADDPGRLRHAQLGKFHAVDVPLWGELGVTARLLDRRVGPRRSIHGPRSPKRWAIWREEKRAAYATTAAKGVGSIAVFRVR